MPDQRTVRTPDGVEHRFPAEATDAQIQEALSPTTQTAKPPTIGSGATLRERVAASAQTGDKRSVQALKILDDWEAGQKRMNENAPVIGAAMGTALTGGVGLPMLAAAMTGGAAGQVAKDVALSPGMAARDRAINALKQGAIQGGLQAVGEYAPQLIGAAGKAVYRGYLKPSLAGTEIAKAKDIVDTAIREFLPITQGGVDKAKILVTRINNEVDRHLKNASVGKPLNLHEVANKVRTFAKALYNRPGAPSEDLASALKVADQIDQHTSLGLAPGASGKIANPAEVTPMQMNETKQALDKAVGDTGFGVERNAGTEARKVGRHAARMAIEDAVPAVAGLNKRESQIIDTIDALTKAVGRESNKNQFTGVSTLASLGSGATTGAAYGSEIAALVAAVATKVALSPGVASRGAMLAARFAQVPGTSVAQAVRMGVLLAQREAK